MGFFRRLRTYMIGFLLGVLLVMLFFRERVSLLTAWMPNERVLLRLQLTDAQIAPQALCQLNCLQLDTAEVRRTRESGKVKFAESDTRSEPKVYRLDRRIGEHLVRMSFAADDSSNTLIDVQRPHSPVDCSCD